ncbi:MAG: hypothetical protein RLY40_743 [Pseudomonadota bacterium]|jgi:hypothetical protein
MPYSFQQKNSLIIPLSTFIRFNKKLAGERLANLFGQYFDDLLACEEELQEHEEFCEKLLKKLLFSKTVAEFNLGKISKQEFISEALIFFKLSSDKAAEFESAWNSLLEFNKELIDVFQKLIKLTEQGKSIYFIGNTNELHAQKVLDLFKNHSYEALLLLGNLPESVGARPLAITETSQTPSIGNVYFCLSYFYTSLVEQSSSFLTKLFTPQSASGLIKQLFIYLTTQNKTKEDILFINTYKNTHAIPKKLAQEIISKDNFFNELQSAASEALGSPLDPLTESLTRSIEHTLLSMHP